MSDKEFFIIIKKVDGEIRGHAIRYGEIDKDEIAATFTKESADDSKVDDAKPEVDDSSKPIELSSPFPESFKEVERSFSQSMLMYRNSVVETIKFAPFFAKLVLGVNIEKIANARGVKREDLSMEEIHVYSLPSHASYSVRRHADRSDALIEGSQHLPKVSTIGIISSYDAILGDLLRVIFSRKPEIIFNSEKEVKFSELIQLNSIEAIRESIVNNEIEGMLRQSHHEQFLSMEKKFGMPLREGLDVWPDFIELCERRNLLTHTGGVVSEQYLKNCEKHGRKSNAEVGERLQVDIEYLASAINIVSEVGHKIIHTMWRKFAPDERDVADSVLNQTGMALIASREYDLAEKLLRFGMNQKQHSSDLVKRMMIVNLANAAKLSGNKESCDKVLASQDWSATSYQFQICVAAVRNDFKEVQRLLELGGSVIEISPSDFRDWPVFRDARKDSEVQAVFENVFGEPIIRDEDKVSVAETIPDEGGDDENVVDNTTLH